MSATTKKLPDFGPAIALFRQIADKSTTSLLTEGPVHPDHKLLELCADALHHLGHAQKAYDKRCVAGWGVGTPEQQKAAYARDSQLFKEYEEGERQGKPYLPNITKLKATTAAGIYAKAAVVRASKTAATQLARSLAQDLLDCPGLRETLWPVADKGDRA